MGNKIRFGVIMYVIGICTGLLLMNLYPYEEKIHNNTLAEYAPSQEDLKEMYLIWLLENNTDTTYEEIYNALWMVESSGSLDPKDGDNGNAIGHYQIWEPYWKDAVEFSDLEGTYQDCRTKEYAEAVIAEYMKRYCNEAWETGDWQTVSRIHNGGPRGATKKNTEKYWLKVQQQL